MFKVTNELCDVFRRQIPMSCRFEHIERGLAAVATYLDTKYPSRFVLSPAEQAAYARAVKYAESSAGSVSMDDAAELTYALDRALRTFCLRFSAPQSDQKQAERAMATSGPTEREKALESALRARDQALLLEIERVKTAEGAACELTEEECGHLRAIYAVAHHPISPFGKAIKWLKTRFPDPTSSGPLQEVEKMEVDELTEEERAAVERWAGAGPKPSSQPLSDVELLANALAKRFPNPLTPLERLLVEMRAEEVVYDGVAGYWASRVEEVLREERAHFCYQELESFDASLAGLADNISQGFNDGDIASQALTWIRALRNDIAKKRGK